MMFPAKNLIGSDIVSQETVSVFDTILIDDQYREYLISFCANSVFHYSGDQENGSNDSKFVQTMRLMF